MAKFHLQANDKIKQKTRLDIKDADKPLVFTIKIKQTLSANTINNRKNCRCGG